MSTPAKKMPYTTQDIYNLAVDGKAIPVAFVNIQNAAGDTPLHLAASKGNVEATHALLLAGADLDAINKYGWTPLHCADHLEITQALLAAGADPNAKNGQKSTPLHCAAQNGNVPVILALLAAGANLDATNKPGDTALHCAAAQDNVGAIDVLLAAGSGPNAKNKWEQTPLHCAAIWGNIGITRALNVGITQALVAAGASLWEENFAAARARHAFSAVILNQFNTLENSLLTTPQEHPHLNFNGLPPAQLEACLVQLATHYQNYPDEKKPLTSLCLDGVSLTSKGEAALACIIAKGKFIHLSLANTGCDITTDSLIGKALLENVTITDLNISRDPITPAMLTAVKPLILRGKLEKLTLLDPGLSVASLETLDGICFEVERQKKSKPPCLVLLGNNPELFGVLKSQFCYLTTWVMPNGSLVKPIPSLTSLIGSMLKISLNCSFFAPPKTVAVSSEATATSCASLSDSSVPQQGSNRKP